jgi:hypothetical protein
MIDFNTSHSKLLNLNVHFLPEHGPKVETTAAVIFRTCSNLPSLTVIDAQEVGPCRSSPIFFFHATKIRNFSTIALRILVMTTSKPNLDTKL